MHDGYEYECLNKFPEVFTELVCLQEHVCADVSSVQLSHSPLTVDSADLLP